MIPKEIIYNTEMDEKRILVFSYFASRRGLNDEIGFSCDNVVTWGGFKTNYNKDKINDQIKKLILILEDNEYIKTENEICRNYFTNALINEEKFDIPNQFALIYLDELSKIRDFKKHTTDTNRINSSILLLVLSYIRVNMLRRQSEFFSKKSDKPEFCYRMYKDIADDIGLSSRYISRSVKILEELDLIVSSTLPRWKDDSGNWHTEVTMFVNKYKYKDNCKLDDTYDYNKELEWGKEYILEKKFLKKKFYQDG